MSKGIEAIVTTIIHAPIDRVWKALIDPEDIARYMMGARVNTDWVEGNPIHWSGEWKGKAFEDEGRVLKVREPDLLAYTHNSASADGTTEEHVVTIELKEVGGVTHLRLTQDGNATQTAREHAEANWTQMLDQLKKMLGEAPVPSPEVTRT